MGKVLKILVSFVILPLSIAALVLAHMAYGKRELVLARNQILTSGYIKLAPTIEDKIAEAGEAKTLAGRDLSPSTVDFIEKAPDVSDFWTKKYSPALELGAKSMLDLNNRKAELMTLYKKNPLGEYEVDPATGMKRMEGEGTMQNLIDEMVKKSGEQLTRLGDTRQMLAIVRDELIDTITDLNKTKIESRKRLKDHDATKEELKKTADELATMKPKVEAAEAAKKVAEEKATDMEKQKTEMEEKNRELELEKKKLLKDLETARKQSQINVDPTPGIVAPVYNVPPGGKGKIIAVNPEWNYVVVQLDDAFLAETMGADLSKPAPTGIILSVKRPGNPETFVAKIKLTQIRAKDKNAIGDILDDWKQQSLQEGDIVIFP